MEHEVKSTFIQLALFEPEIPQNTGNLIRLTANCGAQLHLIHPLGFVLDDKRLRRAGLDYHEFGNLKEHANFAAFVEQQSVNRIFACSTKGTMNYAEVDYQPGDILLMGPETRGLPEEIRNHSEVEAVIRLPMKQESRSLNLSNAAAIMVYEAWRQQGFPGAA